jgi:RNA polymerase sigma-70 factor, ECF subfamily
MVALAAMSDQALACTFRELQHELPARLYRVLHNWEDARDAAQTAFLKCWRRRERLHDVRDLRSWLFRIGLNAALDLRRQVAVRRAVPLDALGDTVPKHAGADTADEVLHREELELLRHALRQLRPAEREVFVLRQDVGLTYDEIAAARGQPVGTVKTLMRAAVRKLRHRLGERPAAGGRHRDAPLHTSSQRQRGEHTSPKRQRGEGVALAGASGL